MTWNSLRLEIRVTITIRCMQLIVITREVGKSFTQFVCPITYTKSKYWKLKSCVLQNPTKTSREDFDIIMIFQILQKWKIWLSDTFCHDDSCYGCKIKCLNVVCTSTRIPLKNWIALYKGGICRCITGTVRTRGYPQKIKFPTFETINNIHF